MLAEGSYFHGAAALSNSLIRNGFQGRIMLGYRGALPCWRGSVQPRPNAAIEAAPGVCVRFVPLDDACPRGWSLGNFKPHFMLQMAGENPEHRALWYFDTDIVITTAWHDFTRWSAAGVLLVLDLAETYMPATHAFRLEWRLLAERAGLGHRPVEGYFCSGFLGVQAEHVSILRAWAKLIDALADEGAEMGWLINRADKPELAKMDQDLLNAAVMATDVPYAVLGVEAMDVFPSARIMSHAMVFDKPWRRCYIRDALIGFQPGSPDLAFWRYADGPIRSFTPAEWKGKQRALRVARVLRHFKQRTVREW